MVTKNILLIEVMNIPGAADVIKKYSKSGFQPNESAMQTALCYPLFILFQQTGISEEQMDGIIEELNKLETSGNAVAEQQ